MPLSWRCYASHATYYRASDDGDTPCALNTFLSTPKSSFPPSVSNLRRRSRRKRHRFETQVGLKALYEIAKVKNAETHSVLLPLESVCKSVRATALSMGLEIVDDRESLKRKEQDL